VQAVLEPGQGRIEMGRALEQAVAVEIVDEAFRRQEVLHSARPRPDPQGAAALSAVTQMLYPPPA
jgi:hypothetical protein